MKKYLLYLIVLSLTTTYQNFDVKASEPQEASTLYSINLDKATIDKGYTVSAFGNTLKLSLVPGILASSTPVEAQIINEDLELPWQLDKLSKIYQFEFKNKAAYDNHKPFYIQFSYDKTNDSYKQVFFYDKNFKSWRPLPTKDYPEEKFVRSLIHLPFARIAVFSFPNTLTKGKASWYSYKNGLYAASPDFPKGSRLRVHNPSNGKFVDVEVNDYGPNRLSHPDRPIDLDKVAFAKIAALSEGVINIKIEPLYIAKDANNLVLGIPANGVNANIDSIVKSAIVMDEASGNVIFAKNSSSTLPLASLTKIVSVYTFLTLESNLDKKFKYSVADAELNYAWCKPWESAKLSVPDGEEMTIKDLVYVSLVGSANNTVETLVRASGINRDAFIKKMNSIVKEWGASLTNFVEPTGLAPENVTNAHDYAIISKNALKNKIVSEASVAPIYKFTTITNKITKSIKNTNSILSGSRFRISGSKTGYLDEALYCLMTKVDTSLNKSIIVVTFGAEDRDTSFRETEKLIEYGIRKIEATNI